MRVENKLNYKFLEILPKSLF